MPLFKFKNPFEKKTGLEEDYLALTITPKTVIACIWNLQNNQINILATAQRDFGSLETIVHEAAVAIDKAAEKSSTDVSKVVFGLSSYWFQDGKLKDEAAKILKNLSSDLELEAQAFVTIAIAINHLLKAEEQITPQALLIGNFEDFTEIHLIKNNEVVSTKTASGEVTTHKVIKLIEDIKQENELLPAKIIIFGQDAASIGEKLKGAKLEELFVHVPKIEIFESESLAKSVAFAQAADVIGHDPALKTQAVEPSQVGFVEGEDVLKLQEEQPVEAMPEPKPEPETRPVVPQQPLDPSDYAVEIQASDNLAMPAIRNPQSTKSKKIIPSFPKLPSLKFSIKKIAIIAALFVLLLIGGAVVAGQTLTIAQVTIKANPKTENLSFSAKVITGSNGNIDRGEIPGQLVTGSAQGSQKAVATGTKKSGTNAKGQIKILNWDKQGEKTFAAGTEVITKDGLKFKLDSETKVASRSATTPGETKTSATASEIGPKYNISSLIDLTIVGFDEVFYSGVTESAFTGGEEKEVTVVSKDDLAKLEKSQTDSLTQKAKQDLESKTGGLKIYDESKIVKIVKKEFDKKVDEEASLVNLDMVIDFQGIAFSENDLKTYLAKFANEKQQGNQEALIETITLKDIRVRREKDTLTISGTYDAGLVPKIDQEKLKVEIAGKSLKDARSIIKAIGDIADVQFIFKPNIPFMESIPRNKDKINFKIEST